MKKIYFTLGAVYLVFIIGFLFFYKPAPAPSVQPTLPEPPITQPTLPEPPITQVSKVYVAVEGAGEVAVLDPAQRKVIHRIDLNTKVSGYMPHNIQVAPDGKSVWITASVMTDNDKKSMAMMKGGNDAKDQVIVIDPQTDAILRRIDIGSGLHLSHIAVSKDGSFAITASQEQGIIYKINTKTYAIESKVVTAKGAGPHGLRLSPDGSKAYVAMLGGKSLGVLDIATFVLSNVPLKGAAVQTAVSPDGAYAAVSVYEAKSIGLYGKDGKLAYIDLPEGSKGPVQLYPTPDSNELYVADQGYYFEQPNGNNVYKIDMNTQRVTTTIAAGTAPHGIVVTNDGRYVYVTNLLSDDVSIIDTSSDKEIARIPVGKMPNGISVWTPDGGTP